MDTRKFKDIDEYIESFPEGTMKLLEELRRVIRKNAPDAKEVISYNMPAFRQNKVIVYFAGHKNHIGLYPSNSGIRFFENSLSEYKYSKGAIQFPLDKALPVKLISEIVKFRVLECQ